MSDEELQSFLEDRRSSKTYKKQTNKLGSPPNTNFKSTLIGLGLNP
jgi:hypothetical protein